jgi:2-dehydropantoate 2-reductase
MTYGIIGVGAVGGSVLGGLARTGIPALAIARWQTAAALRAGGLNLATPEGAWRLSVPVADEHDELPVDDLVVRLTTKVQDADAALRSLADRLPATTPVVCLQNGVAAERMALRRFDRAYGARAFCPSDQAAPASVSACATPVLGSPKLGSVPSGADELIERVTAESGCRRVHGSRERRGDEGQVRENCSPTWETR